MSFFYVGCVIKCGSRCLKIKIKLILILWLLEWLSMLKKVNFVCCGNLLWLMSIKIFCCSVYVCYKCCVSKIKVSVICLWLVMIGNLFINLWVLMWIWLLVLCCVLCIWWCIILILFIVLMIRLVWLLIVLFSKICISYLKCLIVLKFRSKKWLCWYWIIWLKKYWMKLIVLLISWKLCYCLVVIIIINLNYWKIGRIVIFFLSLILWFVMLVKVKRWIMWLFWWLMKVNFLFVWKFCIWMMCWIKVRMIFCMLKSGVYFMLCWFVLKRKCGWFIMVMVLVLFKSCWMMIIWLLSKNRIWNNFKWREKVS